MYVALQRPSANQEHMIRPFDSGMCGIRRQARRWSQRTSKQATEQANCCSLFSSLPTPSPLTASHPLIIPPGSRPPPTLAGLPCETRISDSDEAMTWHKNPRRQATHESTFPPFPE
ncbi:hypothetical protein K474DRAFT_1672207 [Panus rudis PR-1116 ss-1]|nr:hypothetical protein K474DRAFT_1672207 [Panus rudis PR-1116 ss-1]